jgi:hypothetical protein
MSLPSTLTRVANVLTPAAASVSKLLCPTVRYVFGAVLRKTFSRSWAVAAAGPRSWLQDVITPPPAGTTYVGLPTAVESCAQVKSAGQSAAPFPPVAPIVTAAEAEAGSARAPKPIAAVMATAKRL